MESKAAPNTSPPLLDPARLIADHQAGVWRYLRVLGCEPSLADDLTQETFLAVLQRPFREMSAGATASYLRTTAHNLLVSYHRKQNRCTTVSELEYLEALGRQWTEVAAADQGEELLAALRVCLQQLTDRARQALLMRFQDRATREQIATAVNLSPDGAKNLMQRAKKQLKDCIAQQIPVGK